MTKSTAHDPANAWYAGVRATTSHGQRYKFICPSSRDGHADHQCWVGGGGEEPSCSCEGFATHKHCTLTDHAVALLTAMYADRAARCSDGVLWSADHEYARKCAAGSLTAQDRLIWDTVCDETAARLVATYGWAADERRAS